MIRYKESGKISPLTKTTSDGIRIHEKAEDMPNLPVGRFTHGPGGSIFALVCGFPSKGEPGQVLVSLDKGVEWKPTSPFRKDKSIAATDSGAFLCTPKGTLIAAFGNNAEKVRPAGWDEKLKDAPGWLLPTWTARSLDNGKTWQDVHKLHDEWTGANRDMICLRDGRVLFTSMKLLHHPGRHSVLTYASDDEGRTWTASNIIDLGGCGHHGGVTESTLVEFKDGRLLQYIRTNWGQFWRAYSHDRGNTWHPHGPAGVDASSAPAALLRLQSGRIALLWNRYLPEGKDSYPLRGGDCTWSATPTSNFREELSLSFSDDECESWSPPVVIARHEGSEVSYPYVFEVEPGTLWITAHRYKLRMCLHEADFA